MIDPVIEPTWIDYAIIAVLVALLPGVSALFTIPRLKRLSPGQMDRIRMRLYVQIIVSQWLFIAAALYPVFVHGVSPGTVGISLYPQDLFRFGIGAVVVLGIIFGIAWYHGHIKDMPEARKIVRVGMKDIQWIIPRTRRERVTWTLVSVHAGVGEELFFRGYLLAILNAKLPFWMACTVMVVMFGLGHSYQGLRGIVKTAGASIVFLGLYLWSGSIWLSIVLHGLIDYQSGMLGSWALRKNDAPADG